MIKLNEYSDIEYCYIWLAIIEFMKFLRSGSRGNILRCKSQRILQLCGKLKTILLFLPINCNTTLFLMVRKVAECCYSIAIILLYCMATCFSRVLRYLESTGKLSSLRGDGPNSHTVVMESS